MFVRSVYIHRRRLVLKSGFTNRTFVNRNIVLESLEFVLTRVNTIVIHSHHYKFNQFKEREGRNILPYKK